MIQTLTISQVADRLMADEYASWSYAGARAIAEYFEELEEDIGEAIEFDRVAIRCEFSEYDSALDCVEDCDPEKYNEIIADGDKDDQEAEALEWLQENTIVIEFDGGVIVQQF